MINKDLKSVIQTKVYEGLKKTCRGRVFVKIREDELFISILFDGIEYVEIYDHLSDMILSGRFSSYAIIRDFTKKWESFMINKIRKEMFYVV